MSKRRTVLAVTLIFIVGLAVLTVTDLVRNGPTPLDVISILIIAFFAVGIVGALREPPRE